MVLRCSLSIPLCFWKRTKALLFEGSYSLQARAASRPFTQSAGLLVASMVHQTTEPGSEGAAAVLPTMVLAVAAVVLGDIALVPRLVIGPQDLHAAPYQGFARGSVAAGPCCCRLCACRCRCAGILLADRGYYLLAAGGRGCLLGCRGTGAARLILDNVWAGLLDSFRVTIRWHGWFAGLCGRGPISLFRSSRITHWGWCLFCTKTPCDQARHRAVARVELHEASRSCMSWQMIQATCAASAGLTARLSLEEGGYGLLLHCSDDVALACQAGRPHYPPQPHIQG
jgi:hypothetical protein